MFKIRKMNNQVKFALKNIIIFIVLIMNLMSCGGGEYQLSTDDKKMVAVLADVHIAEAGMEAIPDKAVKDSLANIWYGQVFTIHHITKAEFERYMKEIAQNTDRMNAVYGAVGEQLKKAGKVN